MKRILIVLSCVFFSGCYTMPSEIKNNISPLIDEQLFHTASSIYWNHPDTEDRIRTENEVPGVCMDYAIHFIMEWNKKYSKQTNSTAMIVCWNEDYETYRGTFCVEPLKSEFLKEALASAGISSTVVLDFNHVTFNIKTWGNENNQWGVSVGVCFLQNGDAYEIIEWIPVGSLGPDDYLGSYYYFWHPSVSFAGLSGKKINYHAWVVIMSNDGEWFATADPGWWDSKKAVGKSMVNFYSGKERAESYRLGFKQLEINKKLIGEMK